MKHPTESVSQVTAHLFQAKRCRLSFWILLQCPLGNQGKICSEVLPNLIAKVEIKVFSSFSVLASEKLIAFQWQCTKIWSTEVIQLETTCCCSCLFSLPPLSSCHSEKDFHWKEMLARLSRLLFNWLHSPETKTQKFWSWMTVVQESVSSFSFTLSSLHAGPLPWEAHVLRSIQASTHVRKGGHAEVTARDNVIPQRCRYPGEERFPAGAGRCVCACAEPRREAGGSQLGECRKTSQ